MKRRVDSKTGVETCALERLATRLKMAKVAAFLLVATALLSFLPSLTQPALARTMLDVPAWNQKTLNTSSLQRYGCAATSLAMVCNYYGSGKGLQQSVDLFIRSGITDSDGYVNRRTGLVQAVGGTAAYVRRTSPADLNDIRAQLDAGNLIEAWDDSIPHHYVIVGYDGGTFYINDPNGGGYQEANHYAIHGYFVYQGQRVSQSAPAAPTNLAAAASSSTSIVLTWTDNANNEIDYIINRWDGSISKWVEYARAGANATSFTATGLTPGTTYYYYVGSTNSAGTTWPANYVSATTPGGVTVPAAPTNVTATATSSTSILLTWTDNANNETSYIVNRWNGSAWVGMATTNANVTSYSVTSLTPGTTYYYYVGSTNSAGTTWPANYVSATTPAGVDTNLKKILTDTSSNASYLITAGGKRAWIPTGGDYQAIVNNGVQVVRTTWSVISRYPDAGYQAIVRRMDDPAIGGPMSWIIGKSGNGAGYENDYYLTQSAAGKSYVTNSATWTLSNGRGLVRLNAFIPKLDAVAAVVYQVFDGGTYLGSVSVNQKTSYGFIQLGTWQFSSGTIVVKIYDNQGGGPYGALMGFDCVEGIPVG